MESSEPESSYLNPRDRWLTTGLVGIGLVIFAITASSTNLILPKMMTNLRIEFYYIHWVVTAFSIARTVTIPALGWLSGRFGPRTLYLASQALFTIGLLGSALAWDWSSLLFFRILTGASGGLINPLAMAIFYQIFPPNQRGMALGLSLMGWSIGPAIGPIMGGYLLEFASWRVVYFAMIPLSCLGVLLAWWLLPVLNRPERRRLDQYGLLTIGVAVTTFIIALSQGRRAGWDSQSIVVLFSISALAAILFVIIELRHPQPLVELRLLTTPPFLMAALVVCLTTMTFRSTEPMLPVLLQRLLGFEPLKVAWTMMPSQIAYGLAVLATGRLSDRITPQILVVGGLLLYAGSFIGFSGVTVWTTAWTVNAFLCLRFVAEALITAPNNLTALRTLSEDQVMMASGLIGLFRSVANALSTALSVVLWDQNYGRYLQLIAESSPRDSAAFTSVFLHFQQTLHWMGEIALRVPTLSMALMGRILHTEASTAAWREYLIFNGTLALLAIMPALLANSRWWQWVQRKSSAKPEDVEATSEL